MCKDCCFHWTAAALVYGLCALGPAHAGGEITLQTIQKAWESRQEKVRTFRFSWSERYTVAKGTYLDGTKSPENPKGLVAPPETTTFDTDYYLSMDGDKIRYVDNEIEIIWETGKLLHKKGIYVATNAGSKGFAAAGPVAFPSGAVRPADPDRTYVGGGPQPYPLLMMYRAMDPRSVFFKDFSNRYSVVPGRSIIGGRSCVQIKKIATAPSQGITTLWLDPERDFVVMRDSLSNQHGLRIQTNFDEFRQSEHGWIPLKWTRMELGKGGSVRTSSSATVHLAELNVHLGEKEFDLEFPPRTWVHDYTSGAKRQYILLEGGRKRPILSQEYDMGATYEQLLNTEPGKALQYQPGNRRWLLIWGGSVGTGVVVLLVLCWRKWKGAPPKSTRS